MVFIGLDLHKRHITACALDASGAVLAEVRRLSTAWDELRAWLVPFEGACTLVMEATLYCWCLERHLTAAGFAVIVVHPYQVKLIWQTRTKTDAIDARKLAELARAQLLPAIWVPDLATRTHRQILRGRVFLVRQRTVLKNRIHAYLTAENLRGAQADLFGTAGRAWLAQVPLPRVARHFVDLLLANIVLLSQQIATLDGDLRRHGKRDAVARRRGRFRASARLVRCCCRPRSARLRASGVRTRWRPTQD